MPYIICKRTTGGFFMTDTLKFCDRIAEEKANTEFLTACKSGDLSKIEFELQLGRDPNLPVLGKSPLWYAKENHDAVKLLLEYGADPVLNGFYNYCQQFFKNEFLKLCKPYLSNTAGRDVFKHLQNGQKELEKRYALCLENHCKTIMEYNQTAATPLKRYFMVFPFVHTLTEEEGKLLLNIANKGRAADIHIAIGSADGQLPFALQMCCQEKISAPIGANPLLQWYCPGYSVTAFQ